MIKRVDNVENLKVGDEIMLFVVAISLLQTLIDPSTAGNVTSRIVRKVAISIVLFIASGFIFNLLDMFPSFRTTLYRKRLFED